MKKHVIFFHGGSSQEDYEADVKLVTSLESNLGSEYAIHYPFLPDDGTPDLGKRAQITREISGSVDNVVLVAHSLGASMLLACLSENEIRKKLAGIFLLATPFWNGDEDWVKAFKLRPDFAKQLDAKSPFYFYHCQDDEEIPVGHMAIYKEKMPWASFREIPTGGHQFNNDLSLIANDIKSL